MKTTTSVFFSIFYLFAMTSLCAQPDTVWVLHYTETTGYNHNTWDESRDMFLDLCDSMSTPTTTWVLVQDGTGAEFDNLPNLSKFRIVVFSSTSGENGLNMLQRSNMEQYINHGGSFIGIHAAADTYRHSSANGNFTGSWDWYAETLTGASVQAGPSHTNWNHVDTMFHAPASATVDLYCSNLPSPWIKQEEYYYWENGYVNTGSFTPVLSVGETGTNSYDISRMTAQFSALPGGGCAFYTSLGHNPSDFSNDLEFRRLILNAMTLPCENVLLPSPIASFQITARQHTLCWDNQPEATAIKIEHLTPRGWITDSLLSKPETSGCFEASVCGIRATGETDMRVVAVLESGANLISNTLRVTLQLDAQIMDGAIHFPCNLGIGETYEVWDLQGRLIDKGNIHVGESGGSIELLTNRPGIFLYRSGNWNSLVGNK